jgi:aminoglycoside phosphotransferase (APT) family kinase protein
VSEPAAEAATELEHNLLRWALTNIVGAVAVSGIQPMPGNAGLSFGFDVTGAEGQTLSELVIRLSPTGVRRSGNTDVLRQVPLLHALRKAGLPIAELVWSSPDQDCFGTDAIIQVRLAARPLHMFDPNAGVDVAPAGVGPYLRQAVDVLAAIHRLDWQRLLRDWDSPRPVSDELAFWGRLLEKSPDSAWIDAGRLLAEDLAAHDPVEHRTGLFHGDFQTNNVLYRDDGALRAVIDWELAGIGPTGLDLGWLSVMTDPWCWHSSHQQRMRVVAKPADLLSWYQDAARVDVSGFGWYRALACYRFGCIVAFNVLLHRTGRRLDPLYETLASSVDVLFTRGRELLEGPRRGRA